MYIVSYCNTGKNYLSYRKADKYIKKIRWTVPLKTLSEEKRGFFWRGNVSFWKVFEEMMAVRSLKRPCR